MIYKVIFAGTPEFACAALKSLVQHKNFQVELVISQPDKPVGRKQVILPTPVKALASSYDIKVLQPEKILDIEETIKKIEPDFLVVIAYGKILPLSILQIAQYNINLHASLLPKYRGASPIQSALFHGDKEAGVSIMNIEEKMDVGAVYKCHKIHIEENDTSESLFEKISDLSNNLPEDLLEIADGLKPVIQDEKLATYSKKILKGDAEIFWEKEAAVQIKNKLRAFTPWPGIFFYHKSKRIKVITAKITEDSNTSNEIGELTKNGFRTKEGSFLPETIIPEGKKPMQFSAWIQNI